MNYFLNLVLRLLSFNVVESEKDFRVQKMNKNTFSMIMIFVFLVVSVGFSKYFIVSSKEDE